MSPRKERKQEAVARVAAEKAAKRERRAELKAMSPEARKAAKAADRTAARDAKKSAKAARKLERKSMTRAERRDARKRERVYRKVSHRPRRIVGWSVVAVAIIGIGALVAPIVGNISRLLSIEVDSTTAEGIAAREYGTELAGEISDEGIVLLENDGVLPLAEKTVNVFSFASFNLRYGGGGSGGADQSSAVTLYDALEQQGISYNPELQAAMVEAGASSETGSSNGLIQILSMLGGGGAEEPAPDYLTDDVMSQAAEFSDTAMVVLGNDGVEASDFTVDQLRLTDEQRELLDVVTGTFDDVVVVVNSGNQMELGFLEEYPEITGALWIGTPGPQGAVSLAKILDGEVNPSGHLTDTYAYDVSSAPGVENFGDYPYDNVDRALIEYEEGIYLGYRYYETRYAGDEAGYAEAVQYPFGHGLSYTDFEWAVAAQPVVDDQVGVEVTVTNTGDVAGKDVVQVYFSAPYTEGGIEKSAIELAAYGKTSLLEPGESETLSLAFDVRDMSSWSTELGAYVLEAGTYEIFVSTNVHAPVASFETEIADEVVYETDATTGTELENRFEDASGDLTYLSRDDWEGTWPDASDVATEASDELVEAMFPEFEAVDGDVPTTGADNGLVLADLVGLEYDDPQWDAFLDQMTLEEQTEIFAKGAYMTEGIERLGIPAAVLLDGPAGISYFFGDITAAAFPTEVVIASTWNDELAYAMGEAVGTEANAYGVQGWYAPGMNLHRTPLGGRNFEYFSEDPLVSGKMGAAMVAGAESRGVITFMKHFALNEQEVNARSGVHVWADEQAIRELYLRPFEITVTEGGASGAMSSFIHIGPTWSGGNEALLQEVLRGEWGFDGIVSTDAVLGAFMDPAQAVRYGNDLMLAVMPTSVASTIEAELEADPVGVGEALRERVHTVLYALTQTDLFE
ncbi:beta-glucosidase [Agromyces rhizosphaerae]|uniref:Beta-glucosidase n=1 Tax=Agromyces rhizosphaerae TaxID=88374 RepID=A0A9W6CU93_9MICO|nr:glycoside hydrolase family 3 protein [Agromyces rhizosphaerae]GLI26500.1 beta-glucosidase [Agromyces rhizosphaerae]